MNSSQADVPAAGEFYVTGGTLRPDAPSYIERQADKDLCEGLLGGEFCYVLTSRQMGKSSLMVRTVKRLRAEGVTVAVLDLTAIGQNLTIDQWYDGLISRLGQQLDLEDELLDFWHAHPEWGPLQRWLTAIEKVVLQRITGRVVVFVDEIDIVRSLPFSTDEFFAAIREAFNRRSREPVFNRLAFGLLGVASPTDLIRDTRMTPFNIGRRIELHDFTPDEAAPLARGLGPADTNTRALLERVLYWTGGHPYLTQRLCRALADTIHRPAPPDALTGKPIPPLIPSSSLVNRLAEKIFLSRQARDRDDNLIFVRERILRSEGDVAGLLYLYRKIRGGQWIADDETNALVSTLRLSGIIRGDRGVLHVRNRIYAHVFDVSWTHANMPDAEVRRQRIAGRRGILVGLGIAFALILSYLVFGPMARRHWDSFIATRTTRHLQSTYHAIDTYRDTFTTTADIGVGGTIIPIKGSGSIIFEKPNRVNLVVKSAWTAPDNEVRLLENQVRSWACVPALNQYVVQPATTNHPFALAASLAHQVGPVAILPLYRLLLGGDRTDSLFKDTQQVQFGGHEELDGEEVRVIKWTYAPGPVLERLGVTNAAPGTERIPVTVWVGSSNLIVQIEIDLSPWAKDILGNSSEFPLTRLVITERHSSIQTTPMPVSRSRFVFHPSVNDRPVAHFDLPSPDLLTLAPAKRQVAQMIPPRLPEAPPNLIDLTEYYNASFNSAWHPGDSNNNLGILPTGLLQFGNTTFDVRGVVQIAGRQLQLAGQRFYPPNIRGIRVDQPCRMLHFLHAAGWRSADGTLIGTYQVHYANGEEATIPIVYGRDVRDWNGHSDSSTGVSRSRMVWSAVNKSEIPIRLFASTWVNPMPEVDIESIDYCSTLSDSAPFLLSITAEP